MQEPVTGCPFRRGVHRTEVLFPYIFSPVGQWSLSCLDFPGVPTPREEGTVRNQKMGFLPLLSLSLSSALTQTQQLKTTESFCGSAIQAQASQLLLAQDPSQGCRAAFIGGLCGGGSASELTHVAAGSLRSPLAVSQRRHVGLSTGQLTTQHLSSLRAEEGESRPKLETRVSW